MNPACSRAYTPREERHSREAYDRLGQSWFDSSGVDRLGINATRGLGISRFIGNRRKKLALVIRRWIARVSSRRFFPLLPGGFMNIAARNKAAAEYRAMVITAV